MMSTTAPTSATCQHDVNAIMMQINSDVTPIQICDKRESIALKKSI
jgi:hypothetical protein